MLHISQLHSLSLAFMILIEIILKRSTKLLENQRYYLKQRLFRKMIHIDFNSRHLGLLGLDILDQRMVLIKALMGDYFFMIV